MQPPDETQLSWPGQSLWSLIVVQVPGSELPKIRGTLGNSLVEMYIDLYAEVRVLRLPLWSLVTSSDHEKLIAAAAIILHRRRNRIDSRGQRLP